jgi:hypothetical protein
LPFWEHLVQAALWCSLWPLLLSGCPRMVENII